MIGYLKGMARICTEAEVLVITSSGVGYNVRYAYPVVDGEEVEIFIHHHISENDERLWGFRNLQEKRLFELLITVNKVGPSKAYPLVTVIGQQDLTQAIYMEQVNVLTQAPGIGKKVAEQIILSLKDKVSKLEMNLVPGRINTGSKQESLMGSLDIAHVKEAAMALETLGLKEKDFMPIIRKNSCEQMANSEEIIKFVLREM